MTTFAPLVAFPIYLHVTVTNTPDQSSSNFSIMTLPSAHRVLLVTELLEMILLHLSMEDMIVSQMVCTYWRDTIAGSLPIQRILSFADANGTTIDPKMIEAADSMIRGVTGAQFEARLLWPLAKILLSRLNPVSRRIGYWDLNWMSAADPTKRLVLICKMKIRHPDETSKLMRPEASWRKMLLTHPPLPWVYVSTGWGSVGFVKARDERSVTLGEVMDRLLCN